ncbi:MAG: cob(I)yrinic acid a,c-diamide adenosyltransferase [Bacteroidota bacterium]
MNKEKENNFKIYTKQGDKGKTSLLGGSRVSKYHEKIEAYGTLDELNAFIGLLRDQEGICESTRTFLHEIQEKVFAAESIIASDSEELLANLPNVDTTDTKKLEDAIDKMNEELPELQNFIIPGGHKAASHAHVARTVCRRAERKVLQASDIYPVNDEIIQYLNRLSDYFFVLARYFTHNNEITEEKWKTN